MRDSQLRLTVVAPRSDSPVVDVTVAADCPVGTVVPDLVDVVIGAAATASPRRWHVSRSTGGLLDTSKTLRDNGVGDGDILLLDAVGAPAPRLVPVDAASVVADCARTHSASAGPAVREGVGLLVVAVLITVLVGPAARNPVCGSRRHCRRPRRLSCWPTAAARCRPRSAWAPRCWPL